MAGRGRTQKHGTITVHSPELCDEIFGHSHKDAVRSKLAALETQVRQQCHQARVGKWSSAPVGVESEQAVVLEEDSDLPADVDISDLPDVKSVQNLCLTVLQNEQELLEDIDRFLKMEDSRRQCKREMLYQKWTKNVFNPIQSKLNSFMDGEQYRQLDSLRRRFFDNYLEYRNDQIDVFLDTVRPDVYNPQALAKDHPSLQKVNTPILSDPLVVQTSDWLSEGKLVQDCVSGYSSLQTPRTLEAVSSLGRQDTDCSLWLAMQFTDVDSEVRQTSRLRQQCIQTRSVINPAQWHDQVVTRKLIKEEMNVPHKKDVPHHQDTLKLL